MWGTLLSPAALCLLAFSRTSSGGKPLAALAVDDINDDVPIRQRRTEPRRPRRRGRQSSQLVRHHCGVFGTFHTREANRIYDAVLVRCRIHDTVMLELGECGRKYPAPICFACFTSHL